MSDSDVYYNAGYRKPPKRTQFSKGQSGNPKGRPKGSQNFSTILAKAGRQRVKVTTNGRSRYITKFEASMLQLMNKAAAGDLKAIRELLFWIKSLEESEQTALPPPVTNESDEAVMASIVERIQGSREQPANKDTPMSAIQASGEEE